MSTLFNDLSSENKDLIQELNEVSNMYSDIYQELIEETKDRTLEN